MYEELYLDVCDLQRYTKELVFTVPVYTYLLFIVLAVIAFLFFCNKYGLRKGSLYLWRLILVEYLGIIYYTTVFSRCSKPGISYNFIPFWSYFAILEGRNELISEILLNIAVFVPLGILTALSFKRISIAKVATIGLIISLTIELAQLILERGFCETDDIFHNTLGCIIGCLAIDFLTYSKKHIKFISKHGKGCSNFACIQE